MEQEIRYGKKVVTKVDGNRLMEVSKSIVEGAFIPPQKVHTEESVEVRNRAEQDAEYIRFADEEERMQKSGRLIESDFQVRRTPAATKRGTHYAVKKYTFLDNSVDFEL